MVPSPFLAVAVAPRTPAASHASAVQLPPEAMHQYKLDTGDLLLVRDFAWLSKSLPTTSNYCKCRNLV
jgi:hypothetical protein